MRTRMARVGLLLLAFASSRAKAQELSGFALDRYKPSERGSDWFALDSLDMSGRVRPTVGTLGEWAHRPLVIRSTDGADKATVVDNQALLHLGGTMNLFDRYRVGVDVPMVLYQDGSGGMAHGASLSPPTNGALGDLRVSGDVRVFGNARAPATLALGSEVYLPTGSRTAFTSDNNVRIVPRALFAGEADLFVYAARFGVHVRPSTGNIGGSGVGTELELGAAAGMALLGRRLVVGPEVFGATVVGSSEGPFRENNTPVEGLFGVHATPSKPFRIGAGIGTAISRGLGAPSARALLTLEWCPGELNEARSQAPASETVTYAPAPAPRREAALAPPPPVPASVLPPPPPPDRDRDGIADSSDACPDDAGVARPEPEKNGCPLVALQANRIRIFEQINFRFSSAELDPSANPILEAVKSVLVEHPEITRVRIEGHTDSRGSAVFNVKLSDHRAQSVRNWLLEHGIAAQRLEAIGYGAQQPITSNETDAGRRENRRVEFKIVREAPDKVASTH